MNVRLQISNIFILCHLVTDVGKFPSTSFLFFFYEHTWVYRSIIDMKQCNLPIPYDLKKYVTQLK